MPFHPAPPLPRRFADLMPFRRGGYELTRGRHAGLELHYIDHGPRERDAVLLVHGNPTWSFLWRKVIAALPDRRCVAPDLLGFGLSSKPGKQSDHSLDGHADAIAELVEALELERVLLVGQDWGGPICTSVAARLPDRVRGIVLANTSVFVPSSFKATPFHRFARMRGLAEVAFIGLGFPQSRLASVQGDRGSIAGIVARAYEWPLRRFRDRAGPLALARMVPDDIRHPTIDALRRGEEWLERFSGPVALVWGERDPILGRALDRLAQRLPQATVTRTAAGHFLQEEVPQALVSAIVDVWRRAEPTRPARSV